MFVVVGGGLRRFCDCLWWLLRWVCGGGCGGSQWVDLAMMGCDQGGWAMGIWLQSRWLGSGYLAVAMAGL